MTIRVLFFLALSVLFIGSTAQAQIDLKDPKKTGEFLLGIGKYQEALTYLQEAEKNLPEDNDLRYFLGVCLHHLHRNAEARRYLFYITENVKSRKEAYYYIGRSYHQDHRFLEAAKSYKDYLRQIALDHPERERVKDQIRRCGEGLRLSGIKTGIILENMGEKVNSPGDDFRPILSPNYHDRVYFASSRAGTSGGLRTDTGEEDPVLGNYCSDMFYAQVVGGQWAATEPMSYLLNSPRNDVVLGFSDDGSRLYYFKGYTLYSGQAFVDTFRIKREDRTKYSPLFESPMAMEKGDREPYFFKDSILLFASRRPGGYGGLDLYVATRTKAGWSTPENLGPKINSAYDETAPFLCADGRTLYFSSNHAKRSIGGLDIFQSVYKDENQAWLPPRNMGLPINSASDDEHFQIDSEGLRAYFSSNRAEGLGKRDLYQVFFKEKMPEQQVISRPLAFNQVPEFKKRLLRAGGKISESGKDQPVYPEELIVKYSLDPIYYESTGEVVTGRNLRTLQALKDILTAHPQVQLTLTSFSDGTDPEQFDLYFSMKRAETVVDYLLEHGIGISQIQLKAVGSAFPVANGRMDGKPNPMAMQLNRRIDLEVRQTEGLPLEVQLRTPDVSGSMENNAYRFYRNSIKGLSYKVQIAAIKQMYNGDIIRRYPNAMIEKETGTDIYLYTVGLYQTFISANQLSDELKGLGLEGVFVIPYIDGQRVSNQEAQQQTTIYPDLKNFLGL